ncbi:hypothetical protein AVEN_5491-1 [Araneus ventricosus]|uniref:Uncharacterized protein n=1 Tax=Araneus ventricosus TaxID=182803 RepID=A0A4Y2JQ40_ARAVE|nr:hypothetical protein AVEN_5491-1 [Araneus ventricosus]
MTINESCYSFGMRFGDNWLGPYAAPLQTANSQPGDHKMKFPLVLPSRESVRWIPGQTLCCIPPSKSNSGTYGSNMTVRLRLKTSSVKQYPVEEFGEQIIGYGGFQEWSPRSPDMTPMDFFLWGYLKQHVYVTSPPTLQDLQRHITDACVNVTPALLHRVQREVQARVQMCIVADREKFKHRK